MHEKTSSWRSKCWIRLRAYPFTMLGSVLLLVMAIPFCRRIDSEWEQVYVRAAAHLWKGEDLYRIQDGYLYPPFMAFTALPFLGLPPLSARLLWFALNAVSLIALFRWSWTLAGGGRLEGTEGVKGSERLAALLGALCGISYLENCLAHQQTDIVLAAILAGGCLLLLRGRTLLAATSFGVAAACKCTALLWAPYLLWRGRPLAASWLLFVALGVNLLPNSISMAQNGQSWFEVYAFRFLAPLTASNHYLGTWGSDPAYNQSLAGLEQRWCTTSWKWSANNCTIDVRPPLVDPRTFRLCMYAMELGIVSVILWNCGRPFRKILDDNDGSKQALECGMVLMLMLLLSPMSSKAHFGILVLPGCCLARTALHSNRKSLIIVLGIAVILGLICNKDPLGEKLYTLSLWYGVVTWQTLFALLGCSLAYRYLKTRQTAQLPCPALGDGSANRAA
jgi:hypothetical protein